MPLTDLKAIRLLLVHNRYQLPGGEDSVFEAEKNLLLSAGHEVDEYVRLNSEIAEYGLWPKATLGLRTVWAWDSSRELRTRLQRNRPDLVHFHNTFPLISPAAYYVCRDVGVPVVQSLHNPRLLCPAATFYRAGRTCEDCLGRLVPWPGVLHACYRGSRIHSAAVATMLSVHRLLETWEKQVNCYIVFTEFYRRKFVEGGLPAEKITVKPHFVDPDPGQKDSLGSYAVFIGRLSPEKGVQTLLAAWKRLKGIPLKIRGEGALLPHVQHLAGQTSSGVEVLPHLSRGDLVSLLKGARLLVLPSEGHYETFGRVAAEAFACGVPVVASRSGAMEEIVADGRTGLHFSPGDPDDLAAKVDWAWTHPERMVEMGKQARQEYECKYTPERNYSLLMEIYQQVLLQPPAWT